MGWIWVMVTSFRLHVGVGVGVGVVVILNVKVGSRLVTPGMICSLVFEHHCKFKNNLLLLII